MEKYECRCGHVFYESAEDHKPRYCPQCNMTVHPFKEPVVKVKGKGA